VGLLDTASVLVLNTATNTVTATVRVGLHPRGIAVAPDGTRVYVANNTSNTVSVLNTATNTVTATAALGGSPWGLAVTPDGARVYVALFDSNTVSVLNTATNTVAATVPVGQSPTAYGQFVGRGPTVRLVTAKIGVYREGTWYLDRNGNGVWDAGTDGFIGNWGGDPADKVVVGDWNGSGTTKIGIYGTGTGIWYLDKNGNGAWDGPTTDGVIANWGGMPGDVPVVGEWTGGAVTKVGIYRNGIWYLDKNGNGVWDAGTDGLIANWGGMPGDVPVVADWNNTGSTKVGTYGNGTWYLDGNGNGVWDGGGTDACITWGGMSGDTPVVGKW